MSVGRSCIGGGSCRLKAGIAIGQQDWNCSARKPTEHASQTIPPLRTFVFCGSRNRCMGGYYAEEGIASPDTNGQDAWGCMDKCDTANVQRNWTAIRASGDREGGRQPDLTAKVAVMIRAAVAVEMRGARALSWEMSGLLHTSKMHAMLKEETVKHLSVSFLLEGISIVRNSANPPISMLFLSTQSIARHSRNSWEGLAVVETRQGR